MAYNEAHADILRRDLSDLGGVTEKKMFGGLCFMWNGNMLCGVHPNGGMARVGKELESRALQITGVTPLAFTGRPMGGLVEMSADVFENSRARKQLLTLAKSFVGSLPEK